jgi:hypothetical protein
MQEQPSPRHRQAECVETETAAASRGRHESSLARAGKTRNRLQSIFLCAALICVGLVWRLVPLGLPALFLKYGGSILWGALVYFLVRAAVPYASHRTAAFLAGLIALAVEYSRLFHTPWLDVFRLTLPGALLLGRIFSLWNLLAYAAGIAGAAASDRFILRPKPSLPVGPPPRTPAAD